MGNRERQAARIWLILGIFLLGLLGSACSSGVLMGSSGDSAGKLAIVAAENFYGDIAHQLGGDYVTVTSILSDPNIDPHEYESNVQNAAAVAQAKLVIANGGGYDSWIDRLLAAAPQQGRIVLKGYDLAPVKLPDNEHVWYSPTNIAAIAHAISQALQKLDPAHANSYNQNLQRFLSSLGQVNHKLAEIKARYAGTPVGLTETLFLYQTTLMGLDVLTPSDFQKAIAEGNDPPASSVVIVENQIQQHRIKVLIYNEQTATTITNKVRSEAQAQQIPVVAVSETMPPGKSYQTWMLAQLDALETALQSARAS
ncbi:metal ABC transporter solute-binding protein, Zn/Mn family [Thermogemmatispora sp.]|uniref:metal ABC transporter solute-binding protein, Zn/Mn family n=1 Tax=Thermogemmatispora sp. TaxID=1968838 RepID=UPI001DC2B490|nr:zinc ABC transporter substrate-binding protein [Thermogemmatispora sp.]MBX5449672.1 zinc ABC transporter substrate-binding protein [Thermogemmatispora sp.]